MPFEEKLPIIERIKLMWTLTGRGYALKNVEAV